MSFKAKLICAALSFAAGANAQVAAVKGNDAAQFAFRNAVTTPPKNSKTPVFRLSRDYPHNVPATCAECKWLTVPVSFAVQMPSGASDTVKSPQWHGENWDEYLQAILNYVKQGQDFNLRNEIGWRTAVDGRTRWYNVPWMAYDPTAGREYVHGTTNERTANLGDLISPQPHEQNVLAGETEACKTEYPFGFESWSVGYYNEYGGLALGQAIPPGGVPHLSDYLGSAIPSGLPFPTNTVVVKILTTSAPPDCVPYLASSPEWQIDRHKYTKAHGYECDRAVQISHVVQVDVAVVDPRSPSRWVYGTFGFNGNAKGTGFWDRLVPIGLQWGSDPWTFPAVPKTASLPLQQSVINTGNPLFEHLGCMDRLAGPVDNPASSCTSCHASGYAAPKGTPGVYGVNVPPSFGFPGMCQVYSLDNAAYFQNQTPPQRFPGGRFPDAFTMDTSLQLEVAFTQYGYFQTDRAPQACTNPNQITPANPAMKRLSVVKSPAR